VGEVRAWVRVRVRGRARVRAGVRVRVRVRVRARLRFGRPVWAHWSAVACGLYVGCGSRAESASPGLEPCVAYVDVVLDVRLADRVEDIAVEQRALHDLMRVRVRGRARAVGQGQGQG
jgi:hypothetical protein